MEACAVEWKAGEKSFIWVSTRKAGSRFLKWAVVEARIDWLQEYYVLLF